jgi:hypothetical protein
VDDLMSSLDHPLNFWKDVAHIGEINAQCFEHLCNFICVVEGATL